MPGNAEIVRAALAALTDEGVESVLHLIAEDFEGVIPPSVSAEPDTYRGIEGARRWFEGFEGLMEDVALEPQELIEVDEGTVVGLICLRARGVHSGIEADQISGQVFRISGGKVHRIEVYPSFEEARAAVESTT